MKELRAKDWKEFYASERQQLGRRAIERMIENAEVLSSSNESIWIFPHTKLSASGRMIAAVARSVIESGAERVLTLGVLHGGRESDADIVANAKAGQPEAIKLVRKIHGAGSYYDAGMSTEEFSLDNFKYLIQVAAEIMNRPVPAIIERYPFLTGEDPLTLPGMEELRRLTDEGILTVATADMIHHGIGYDTPDNEALSDADPNTTSVARHWIEKGLSLLAERDFSEFLRYAEQMRSDFRHTGPVLRELMQGEARFEIQDLSLVDYSDVLESGKPTWVAAALIKAG
jgi:predicted class III extradiol MEMO1 family dioxygenase